MTNPELLKANMKWAYEGTKDSINKGIEKVKDPEFQNNVKQSVSNGFDKVKEGTIYAMDVVSGRELDQFQNERERQQMERAQQRSARESHEYRNLPNDYRMADTAQDESPFDILGESDDEEEGVSQKVAKEQKGEEKTKDLEIKQEENVQESSSDEEETDEEDNIINEESVVLLKSKRSVKKQDLKKE